MATLTPIVYALGATPAFQAFALDAATVAGDKYKGGRRMALVMENTVTNATATVTVTGQADPLGRTASITMTLSSSEIATVALPDEGFLDSAGNLNLAASATTVKYKLLVTP